MSSVTPKYPDYAWLDGRIASGRELDVSLFTHTLHYGLGVFEGIRCYRQSDGTSAVFRLQEHVRRLFESAKLCLMEIPYTESEIIDACHEVIRVNNMPEAYLRPLAFYGDGAMGLGAINKVRVAVATWVWGAYLGDQGIKTGIRAKVSSFSRMPIGGFLTQGKIIGQYVNSILAKREAVLAGYDEAVLLNAQGHVAEGSGENIFIVRGREIVTPPLSVGILGGITRDTLIRIARDRGYTVTEAVFSRDSLYLADEVFFTGTAAEVTPLREVDDRKIGRGTAGPVTQDLQKAFFRAVRGEDAAYREWLSPVDFKVKQVAARGR